MHPITCFTLKYGQQGQSTSGPIYNPLFNYVSLRALFTLLETATM
jgi:hypothetical protein